jgi:hypothetical protein
LSTVSRRARPDVRLRADPARLNDLFTLFPDLPRFQRQPIADQFRRVREKVERMQRHAKESMARHRAVAAQVRASWLAKRRG